MRIEVPESLPGFAAITLASGAVAFFAAGVISDTVFGRPSSTEALVIPFGAFYATIAGLAGYVGGIVVRTLWRLLRLRETPPARAGAWLLGGYASVVLAGAGAGVGVVLIGELQAKPRVLTRQSGYPGAARS